MQTLKYINLLENQSDKMLCLQNDDSLISMYLSLRPLKKLHIIPQSWVGAENMQDLDNRKTLATKCKGETLIENNCTSPKFSSLCIVYYKKEHINLWSYSVTATISCAMAV